MTDAIPTEEEVSVLKAAADALWPPVAPAMRMTLGTARHSLLGDGSHLVGRWLDGSDEHGRAFTRHVETLQVRADAVAYAAAYDRWKAASDLRRAAENERAAAVRAAREAAAAETRAAQKSASASSPAVPRESIIRKER
jgi:hypothetical protein